MDRPNEAVLAEPVDLESPGVRGLLAYIAALQAKVAELEAIQARLREVGSWCLHPQAVRVVSYLETGEA